MTSPALSAERLSFSYGTRRVVAEVDLAIQPGELLGLLGPNGAGKTTLLHLLTGYLQPASGQVTLAGNPLRDFSRREIAQQLAIVPQHSESAFSFSVLQVVLMGRHPFAGLASFDSESDIQIAREALDQVGLSDFGDRMFDQLSGGEQRLVLIARALAQQTPILLLDEPLAALDLRHQYSVLMLLQQLRSSGKAVLATFHDLNAAAEWCDRIALMHQSQLRASGVPADVLKPELLQQVYDVPLQHSTHTHIAFAARG
jgi:iron complex transport system ATP-binding protein